MNASSTHWYYPAPSEISAGRISLDFGPRPANLFFREMVVRELGRIWFVLGGPSARQTLRSLEREWLDREAVALMPDRAPIEIIIGIDYGTRFTKVAVGQEGQEPSVWRASSAGPSDTIDRAYLFSVLQIYFNLGRGT
jgi:hypothetical protein